MQGAAASGVVVSLVRVELFGPLTWPSSYTLYGRHRVYKLFKDRRIVDVGSGQHYREGHTVRVGNDVALGAAFTSIYRAGAGLLAPFFAGMLAESRAALDQSITDALPSPSRRTLCKRIHTPASCQSLRRLQQATPLTPNPSGSIPQGTPVFST